jgi:hypothetical protein
MQEARVGSEQDQLLAAVVPHLQRAEPGRELLGIEVLTKLLLQQ